MTEDLVKTLKSMHEKTEKAKSALSILNNEQIRNQLIKNGTKSSHEYLSYQNNSSSKLIEFLEKLG